MKKSTKILIVVLAAALVAGGAVGGSLAYTRYQEAKSEKEKVKVIS